MTWKKRFEQTVKLDVEARVREGVKAVLEEVLEEEMSEHLEAGYRELTPTRRGERNGHYTRNLVTPAGKIERLEVPRDREGEFATEVFERYKRMTGDVEEAVLEMYLSGVSVRKIAGVTDALSKVRIGKDAHFAENCCGDIRGLPSEIGSGDTLTRSSDLYRRPSLRKTCGVFYSSHTSGVCQTCPNI